MNERWQRIRRFRHSRPGRRFQGWYADRQRTGGGRIHHKVAFMMLGGLILLAGVLMLVTPGPGWLAIFLGAALLAGESLAIARFLDRLEIRLRRLGRGARRWWRRRNPPQRVCVVALPLLGASALAYAAVEAFI